MIPLDGAHEYVRRGWGVIPLHGWDAEKQQCRCIRGPFCPEQNRGKHPSLGNDWQERALTAGADVEVWWEDHPNDNVGILTGPESGIFVFDVDGAAGVKSVTDFASEYGALPPTRIVRTGSGGLHYFYRHPGHFTVHGSTKVIAPGIDIRGKGGQVVAPPSVSGRGAYEVIADHPIAEAPEWLLDLLREHSFHIEHGRTVESKSAEPVDVAMMSDKVRVAASTLVEEDKGRFKHFHHIVATCREAGYTQGQTVTIVAPWCAAVDKYVGRIEAEVARCWGKLEAEAEKANEWLEGIADTSLPAQPSQNKPATDGTAALKPQPIPDPAEDATATDNSASPTDLLEPTWRPVDLEPILDGTYTPETPTLFPRSDHQNLLYSGRVHSFHGESESGKSLIAQAESARLITNGHSVLYIDFESDAAAIVGRLTEMGCEPDQLRSNLIYLRPDNDPRKFAHEREELTAILQGKPELVVIDGVTDALGIFGAGTTDNDEISAFMRSFPRMIARKTEAAVVLIDHVTKDADTRGRYAVGGQAKMNALDGSAFVIEVVEPLGRGMRGIITMRVAKDRPGGVRPYCGGFRKMDRTQEAARVVVDSTGDHIDITVEAPHGSIADAPKPGGFRPTTVMQRVSEFLEDANDAVSWNTIKDALGGKEKILRQAVAILDKDGFVGIEKGPNRALLHTSTKAYRSAEDGLSEDYIGWISGPVTPVTPGDAPGDAQSDEVGDAQPVPPLRDRRHSWGVQKPSGDAPVTPTTGLDYSACNGCGEEYLTDAIELGHGHCPECAK